MYMEDVETVISAMGLKMEDFTYAHPLYNYNTPVKYLDQDFTMRVATNGKDAFGGVMFMMVVEDDPEKAANIMVDLRDKLIKLYGKSETNKYSEGRPKLETMSYDEIYGEITAKEASGTGNMSLQWKLAEDKNSTGKDSVLLFTCSHHLAGYEGSAAGIKIQYGWE